MTVNHIDMEGATSLRLGRQDGSGSKELAVQVPEPEFNPLHPQHLISAGVCDSLFAVPGLKSRGRGSSEYDGSLD